MSESVQEECPGCLHEGLHWQGERTHTHMSVGSCVVCMYTGATHGLWCHV